MKHLLILYRSRRFRAASPLAALILLWWLATSRGWVSPLVLVPFGRLWEALRDPLVVNSLLVGTACTALRLVQGYAVGVVVGTAAGALMAQSPAFDRILGPSFHAMRQVAILAWIPLLTAWFGTGTTCKVLFVAIAASMPMVLGTHEGIRSVPARYRELGRVLGIGHWKTFTRIVWPAAAPSIFSALQLSLIFSWFSAIAAEYAIGSMAGGIGSVVVAAQEHFRTDIVLLGVLLISGVGIGMNKGLRVLSRQIFHWKEAGA